MTASLYPEMIPTVHFPGAENSQLDTDQRFRIYYQDAGSYRSLAMNCRSFLTDEFRQELAQLDEIILIKTHELPFDTYFEGERVIRVVRHAGAALWSYYRYLIGVEHRSITPDKVIVGANDIQNWSAYTEAWFAAEARLGAKSFRIRFEDLVQNAESLIAQVQDWTHWPIKQPLSTFPTFEHWHNRYPAFYRGGQNGDWMMHFVPEHFIHLYQHHAEAMAKEGYRFDFPPPALAYNFDERIHLARLGMMDVEALPKVEDAGQVHEEGDLRYQVMFNGVKVPADSYYGGWQSELIRQCRGHHEPQEEYVFSEIVNHAPEGAAMIELGSYWAFYSAWFLTHVKGSRAVLVEPQPESVVVSLATLALNDCQANVEMAIIGERPPEFEHIYLGAADRPNYVIPLRTVDELMETYSIEHLYVLHSDIQGAELKMLEGAQAALENHRIDYLVISTHSYAIHLACLEKLAALNYRVIAEHNEFESYSYDGLIAACSDNLREIDTLNIHKRTTAEWTWEEAAKSCADMEGLRTNYHQFMQSGELRSRFEKLSAEYEQLQNERAALPPYIGQLWQALGIAQPGGQETSVPLRQQIDALHQQIAAQRAQIEQLRQRKIVRVMAKLGRPLI